MKSSRKYLEIDDYSVRERRDEKISNNISLERTYVKRDPGKVG